MVIQSVALNNSVFVETLLSFFFEITILHVSTTGEKKKKKFWSASCFGGFFFARHWVLFGFGVTHSSAILRSRS